MANIDARLSGIRDLVGGWLAQAPDVVRYFLNEDTGKFVDYFGSETNRPHAVTTARALVTLNRNSWLRPVRYKFPDNQELLKVFVEAQTKDGYWSSDPDVSPSYYDGAQVLWALESMGLGDGNDIKRHRDLLSEYIGSYTPTAPIDPSVDSDRNHPFILYLAARALAGGNGLDLANRTAAESAFFVELSTQLSFLQLEDTYSFDLTRLGLSVAGLLNIRSNWRPVMLGQARDIFLKLLVQGGRWSPNRHTVRVGKQLVGCSSLEIVLEILRSTSLEWFQNHLEYFAYLLEWLKAQNVNPAGVPRWRGDTSPHTTCWFNFLVLDLLDVLEGKLAMADQEIALLALPGSRSGSTLPWVDLIDTGFKGAIQSRIIDPVKVHSEVVRPARSAILFGPPGTAKTTIVRSLAKELGWPLIELSPGDFCTKGIEGIFARLAEIFGYLFRLKEVVVLFDEIDELVMARDIEKEKFGRFLTTTMLPWLQQLRDYDRIVFIVNTNHVERYDSAIRRPGRFDLVLPVGPPSRDQMKEFLLRLMRLGVASAGLDTAIRAIEGIRTVGEIMDIYQTLRGLPEDQWVRAVVEWNGEHPAAISTEELEEFDRQVKRFVRR